MRIPSEITPSLALYFFIGPKRVIGVETDQVSGLSLDKQFEFYLNEYLRSAGSRQCFLATHRARPMKAIPKKTISRFKSKSIIFNCELDVRSV